MKAGLIRRGTAFVVDMFVSIMPAVSLTMWPGAFVPIDEHVGVSTSLMMVAIPVVFAYLFLGVAALPNTYGRFVVGVRVRDQRSGRRPSYGQALLRMLTTGLWPIEAAFIVISRSKQRLGDRWAKTDVVRYSPSWVWWKRLAPGLGVVGSTYALLFFMVPVVNGRMEISDAARRYAIEQLAVEPIGAPRQVWIQDRQGVVTMTLEDGRGVRLSLSRSGTEWRPLRVEEISLDEVGGWGYSIQYGGAYVFAGANVAAGAGQ